MEMEKLVVLAQAIGCPSRLAVLRTLGDTGCSVTEAARRTGLAVSTVAFHLSKLVAAGLATSSPKGRQAIYSWKGTDAGYLTGFTTRYPRAIVVQLVRNYRSSPQILDCANKIASTIGARPLRPWQFHAGAFAGHCPSRRGSIERRADRGLRGRALDATHRRRLPLMGTVGTCGVWQDFSAPSAAGGLWRRPKEIFG